MSMDDTASGSMHRFRGLRARQEVEEYRKHQLSPNTTSCLEESSGDESDFPKIVVGSFGFAEEGNAHFLKMDVWDAVPVRCNSR
jgi:hypothetical protein